MIKTNKEETYKEYGDVNPIEHGGQWVKKIDEHVYDIITIQNIEDVEGEPLILFSEVQIEVTDKWINKNEVISCCDTPKDNEEMYALDIVSYYGAYQSGGSEERLSINEVKKRLTELEIKF